MDDRRLAERLWLAFCATSGFLTIFLGATYVFWPASRDALTQEDRFLENLASAFFAVAFVIAVSSLLRRRRWFWLELIIPVAALAGFLDEVSFGQRWFGFTAPELANFPIDGVHDLFLVLYSVFETDEPLYLALYAIVAVACLVGGVWALSPRGPARGLFVGGLSLLGRRPSLVYVALAVGYLAIALVLDLDLIEHSGLMFLEELLECQCAVALCFAGAALGLDLEHTSPAETGREVVPARSKKKKT